MSLRKVLFLTRTACCKIADLHSKNFARQKLWLLTANAPRFYSAENIDKKDAKTGKTVKIDKTVKSEKIEKTAKAEAIEKPIKSEKIDKPAKSEKIEKHSKSEKIEKHAKAEKIEKPGKSEKIEKPEKVDILGRFFPQGAEDPQSIKKEQETFEKENKEKTEENEKSWRRMKLGFAVFGGAMTVLGGCLVIEMGAPRHGDDGELIEDEFTHMPLVLQYLRRTWKELTFYEKMIKEPSREKLLPDPLPPPYQPTYTLVLEFTDVLVHPDWSYQTGWRFKKRPGVDQFLQSVANSNYEVVIFTSENAFMIWPVLDKLDPENKFITYRLFRDSTHFIDGVHVKNLEGLNRDLSKVIVVDWNKAATKFHPQNSLILKKWKGADDDTALLDLANLLQTIAMSDVIDVREVLTYYSQFDDPIAAFRENQRKLMEQLEEKEREGKGPDQPLTRNWLRTFTRR